MNHLILMGRLAKDPEIKYSNGENAVAYGSYTLCVDRPRKKDTEPVTDFIYCKAVGKQAEFAEKYLHKGIKICIHGRIRVDNYTDKDGNKRSTTYVQVFEQEFCESKSSGGTYAAPAPETNEDGFMNLEGIDDSELPFN